MGARKVTREEFRKTLKKTLSVRRAAERCGISPQRGYEIARTLGARIKHTRTLVFDKPLVGA